MRPTSPLLSSVAAGCTTVLLIGLLAAVGCSRSPEAQKARHLERGDKYAARDLHREAIIEYRNVLQHDPANVRAIRQLGRLHYQLDEPALAFRYLLKTQELAPDDVDVRLKLGMIYFLAGKNDEARRAVAFALEREPRNIEGLALLASLAVTPDDLDRTIPRLEAARDDLGGRATLDVALGGLYLRKRDTARAERAFQDAVAHEPRSVEAHLALGNFYLVTRDAPRAEQAFKAAADLAPVGSPARMRLVDFYLLTQAPEKARRILAEMTEKAPDYLPGWRRLAEVAFQERKYEESLKALQAILKKNPSDVDGRLLRGRLHLAKRETPEAIQEFQQAIKLDPRNPQARYQLALAQVQAGNVQQAKAALQEAIALAPNLTDPVLVLAELNLQGGAVQPAIEELQRLVARHPGLSPAYGLLGSAYLARREPGKATDAFRKVAMLSPKDPRGPYLVGIGLRAQGRNAEAKKEFEAALALAPGYVEPMAQLASVAIAEKQPDAALARLNRQVSLAPKSGGLQYLLGLVHLARREPALAEGALLRAIEMDPHLVDAYVRLGRVYAADRRYDEALAKLNRALDANPKALHVRMLAGIVYERKGDMAGARQAYEAILAVNPRFAPAANNLAWLDSEHGGDKERALQLAQVAKEAAPEDPHIADTLGWILYQRGLYQRAAGLFRESATKLPNDPVIQYHLGLASLKAGDKEGARKALAAALGSPVHFAGKDEAQRALADLR